MIDRRAEWQAVIRTSRGWLLVAAAVTLAACAEIPAQQDGPLGSSVIGIDVRTRPIVKALGASPVPMVWFVRLDEAGSLKQDRLIFSNYKKKSRVYLLNVEPGRYAAVVAADTVPKSANFITFFSEELARLTVVTIAPGEIVFMGRFVVDHSGCAGADRVQDHYGDLVEAAKGRDWYYNCYLGSEYTAEQGESARKEFLERAMEDFVKSDWRATIEQQLSK